MLTPLTSGFLIWVSIRWPRSARRRRPDPSGLRRLRVRARGPARAVGGTSGSESRVVPTVTNN